MLALKLVSLQSRLQIELAVTPLCRYDKLVDTLLGKSITIDANRVHFTY